MPTPVSSARQCLAAEAAAALDEAVAAARRRAHAQTTSLHVVYALLSSSSSSTAPSLLRDAVSRARSSAYSPRLQFKALELCFGVALDRLPSSSHHHHHQPAAPPASDGEPPVSNSLMAAIKRSQAHQRRNPDTFHLYHHHQQQSSPSSSASSSSFAGVKVELQQLVLAILDDPVVSRVFGEAGFRSCDIKLAVLRPPLPILRFPRAARCPPLFLCNFSTRDDLAASPRGFPFPFAGQLCSDGGDENCRRIGEVLARRSSRNPMLVGVGAGEAARDFAQAVEWQNWATLPPEIHGLKFVSIEREVAELAGDGGAQLSILERIEELGRQAEEPGLVVSIGDLKGLVEGEERCSDAASCLVSELTRVLELHNGRLWVMGWSATYEAYMKLLSRYPLLDKDWDLQLLPITSLRPAMGGLLPRPQSLMESFVPFGGFFPAAYESKSPLSNPYQSTVRCQHCNDKYEQEVAAILKGRSTSLEDQHQPSMPAWLRKADIASTNGGLDSTKAKDDKSVLNAKVMDLQKKWNDNCQRLHRGCEIRETDNDQILPKVGLPCVSNEDRAGNQISKYPAATQNRSGCDYAFPAPVDVQKITKASKSLSLPLVSEPRDKDLISKLQARLSKSEQLQTEGFGSYQGAMSEIGIQDDRASPSSVTSVTTDLVLGTVYEPPCNEEKAAARADTKHSEGFSGCLPSEKLDKFGRIAPEVLVRPTVRSLSASKVTTGGASAEKFDASNYKAFYTSFIEKVGRQEEALRAITEAIVRCKTGHERHRRSSLRGDIWLNFLGPDRVGKKRAAVALAELIFGSRENLVCIDLGYQNGLRRPNTICDQQEIDEYDARFRGKTIVDHIAGEVSKNPSSVVFLENLDKADLLVQSSLSQAIQTGRFPDSHGREFSVNNVVFVTTAKEIRSKTSSLGKECSNFSEERILGAQGWQMKIVRESISEVAGSSRITSRQELTRNKQTSSCSVFVSKRKLDVSDDYEQQHESFGTSKRANKRPNTFLDLNLPVNELVVASDTDCSSGDDNNSLSDNSEAWVEEFSNLMDETIDFKPFDFDALADYVLKEINRSFRCTIGSEFMLEIDAKVMEQILAAAWLLENTGELNHWLEHVVARSFVELRRRHNLSARAILRLVACEGSPMDRTSGILLPSRIVLE